jgi:hypothetical protein
MGASIRSLGGPMSAHAIGAGIRAEFHGELEARRQLLVAPPGVAIALGPPGPGSSMASRIDPTTRLRPPPSARSGRIDPSGRSGPGDFEPSDDTSLDTMLWSHPEVTAVDASEAEEIDGDVRLRDRERDDKTRR